MNRRLPDLAARLKDRPEATIEYFVPDERKAGGAYVSVPGLAMETVVPKVLPFRKGRALAPEKTVFITKRMSRKHRRPSTCLPSRCSLTLPKRQNENLTKNAFSKRLLLTQEHTPVNTPFLIFYGISAEKSNKCHIYPVFFRKSRIFADV